MASAVVPTGGAASPTPAVTGRQAAHPGLDHPGMPPAGLLGVVGEPPRGGSGKGPTRVRRTGRDWAVDVVAFVLSTVLGALLLWAAIDDAPARPSDAVVLADHLVGVACCAALWFRRRWPVGVAVALALPAAVFAAGAVAAAVAVFTVAVHRRPRVLAGVAGLHLAASAVFPVLRPGSDPYWVAMVYTVVIFSGLIAWGLFVRARRQLVWSLRERAERAEATQRLLAEQARAAERARIAREMHDVLAHKVTMMALHAGALEVRPDLPPAEVARTAGLIRSSARQALEELRVVIGMLREDAGPGEVFSAPQPTLADVVGLVEESRRAGMHVDLTMAVDGVDAAPGALGRDVYRIVQEALTNVGKHARGTATTVSVRGGPGDGLRVTVANRLPVGGVRTPALPGAGAGLTGLSERVAVSGGRLSHGPSPDGRFVVDAELVWAAA
jgi:signal transduction histidine kinase